MLLIIASFSLWEQTEELFIQKRPSILLLRTSCGYDECQAVCLSMTYFAELLLAAIRFRHQAVFSARKIDQIIHFTGMLHVVVSVVLAWPVSLYYVTV
jgi:hypothetical protein